MKHTPGPWTAVRHEPMILSRSPWMGPQEFYTVRDKRNVHIVTVEPFDGLVKDDIPGNAQLMAASPELLKLAERLVTLIDGGYLRDPEWETLTEYQKQNSKQQGIYDQAQAIIKKARGR
jgi:hypothetical protein